LAAQTLEPMFEMPDGLVTLRKAGHVQTAATTSHLGVYSRVLTRKIHYFFV